MRCNDFTTILPDYLNRELETEQEFALEEHMDQCDNCRQEFTSLTRIWGELGKFDEPEPSENLRNNFYNMLENHKPENSKNSSLISRTTEWFGNFISARQFALTALTLFIGVTTGYMFNSSTADRGELRREVDTLKQQVSLSLINNESSSNRLKGVVLTSTLEKPDNNTLHTLLNTLNSDPSINVRLSAVDALYLFRNNKIVKDGLVKALENQQSPMVQMALIELLSEIKEKKALKALQSLMSKKSVNPQVKKEAEKTAKLLKL